MKATIESTDQIVPVKADGREVRCRVWEGKTERGIPFTAYVVLVQVASEQKQDEFEQALKEHKKPSAETRRAIDRRLLARIV
jgi:hypothetical protein